MDSYKKILGELAANCFIPLIEDILDKKKSVRYHFTSHEDFQKLQESDPKLANSQYMKELLYRAHFASMSSIAKNLEWIKGMKFSYDNGLYLPFASSFRSLIESAADSFEALQCLGVTIAEHNEVINNKLNKVGDEFVILSQLEKDLIHYSHARRVERGEDAPQSHKAKNAANYVKGLDTRTGQKFYNCYGELCQLTHPAAQGVLHMMPQINESDFSFENGFGKEKIEALINKHSDLIEQLVAFAFNPSLISLKVLNHIELDECHSNVLYSVNLDGVQAWKKCEKYLGVNCT
jgi:hypothetical protein